MFARRFLIAAAAALTLSGTAAACSSSSTPSTTTTSTPSSTGLEKTHLVVAVPHIIQAAPLFLAIKDGYFSKQGLTVTPEFVSATTAARKGDLVLLHERGLRWIESPRSEAQARRGFCGECGSSLFWDAPGRETVSIAAGTLDGPTGLHIASHWYVSQASDYYELSDDGLPRHEHSGEGELP